MFVSGLSYQNPKKVSKIILLNILLGSLAFIEDTKIIGMFF